MQTLRILQAVVLLTVVALAASCAASKEYTSKIFPVRVETEKTNQATALRFLELDQLGGDSSNWVNTDAIMGRDTVSQTLALDNLARTVTPAQVVVKKEVKSIKDTVTATPPTVAKNVTSGEVRSKRSRD